jgi:hypothetical protein
MVAWYHGCLVAWYHGVVVSWYHEQVKKLFFWVVSSREQPVREWVSQVRLQSALRHHIVP